MTYQDNSKRTKDYLVAYLGPSIGKVPIDPPKDEQDLAQTIQDIYQSRGLNTIVRKVQENTETKYLNYSYEFDVGPVKGREHTWSTGNVWLTNPRTNITGSIKDVKAESTMADSNPMHQELIDHDGEVIIGDVHIGIYTSFAKPSKDPATTLNDRSLLSIDPLAKAFQKAQKLHYPLIVNGDLFDARSTLDVRILAKVFGLFNKYQEVHVILVAGNHDQVDNTKIPENSLTMFGTVFPNVQVITKPTKLSLMPHTQQVFIPYSEDVQWLKDSIKGYAEEARKNKDKYQLFAHIGVDGANDGGLYVHRLGGAFGLGDLYPDDFHHVFLSHYHRRQHLAPNVEYIGSSQQHSFSDEDQQKGITVVASTDLLETFIDLSSFYPKFLTVDTTNQETKANIKDIDKGSNYVRMVVHSKAEGEKYKKQLADSQVDLVLKEKPQAKNRLGIKQTDSEAQIVSTYADKFFPKAKEPALQALTEAVENQTKEGN